MYPAGRADDGCHAQAVAVDFHCRVLFEPEKARAEWARFRNRSDVDQNRRVDQDRPSGRTAGLDTREALQIADELLVCSRSSTTVCAIGLFPEGHACRMRQDEALGKTPDRDPKRVLSWRHAE